MSNSFFAQVHKNLPAGAVAFSAESLLTLNPSDLPTDKTQAFKRSLIQADSNFIYVFTKYGCRAYVNEATSWGVLSPTEQPPLRFVGRHYWRVGGTNFLATSDGIEAASQMSPYVTTVNGTWPSFMEFKDYGVHEGDPPIIFQGSGEIYIQIESGRYTGPTPPPLAPNDKIMYKTILSGYKLDQALAAKAFGGGSWHRSAS
jgi:hypothetical protein